MILSVKPGVKFHSLAPQMVLAHSVVSMVFLRRALDCVITGGSDGKHSATSLHYSGNALDYRTRHITNTQAIEVHAEVRKNLPADFDVILHPRETTDGHVITPGHLHVEYQPRKP